MRAGVDFAVREEPENIVVPNHAPTYDDWGTTKVHLDEVGGMGCFTKGSWLKPKLASALLTVIRDKHRRQVQGTTVPAKGRVAFDTESSGVNGAFYPWRFVYDGVDAAVRLLKPGRWLAKLDITKYFLQWAASPNLQAKL